MEAAGGAGGGGASAMGVGGSGAGVGSGGFGGGTADLFDGGGGFDTSGGLVIAGLSVVRLLGSSAGGFTTAIGFGSSSLSDQPLSESSPFALLLRRDDWCTRSSMLVLKPDGSCDGEGSRTGSAGVAPELRRSDILAFCALIASIILISF